VRASRFVSKADCTHARHRLQGSSRSRDGLVVFRRKDYLCLVSPMCASESLRALCFEPCSLVGSVPRIARQPFSPTMTDIRVSQASRKSSILSPSAQYHTYCPLRFLSTSPVRILHCSSLLASHLVGALRLVHLIFISSRRQGLALAAVPESFGQATVLVQSGARFAFCPMSCCTDTWNHCQGAHDQHAITTRTGTSIPV
jgi:hypothetical protein